MHSSIRRFFLLVVVIASVAVLLVGCDNPTGSDDDDSSNGDDSTTPTSPGSGGEADDDPGGTLGAVAAQIGADRDTTGGNTRVEIYLSTGTFQEPAVATAGSDVVRVSLSRTAEIESVGSTGFDFPDNDPSDEWTATASFVSGSSGNVAYQVTGGSVTVSTGNFITNAIGSNIDVSVSGSLEVKAITDTTSTFTLDVDYSGKAELFDYATLIP